MFQFFLRTVFVFGLAATASFVWAKSVYVTDDLQIALRSGPSLQHRILTFLSSGALLTIEDEDTEIEWAKVSTGRGSKGWVQKAYLSETPVAKILLKSKETELQSIKTKQQALLQQIRTLTHELKEARETRGQLSEHLQAMTKEHEALKKISGNALQTEQSNQTLREELKLLSIKLEQFEQENITLRHSQRMEGMIQGTLAVLCGALLAVFIPRISVKKHHSGWD